MNTVRFLALLLLPFAAGAAEPAAAATSADKSAATRDKNAPLLKTSAPHPLEPRFKQVNERIAAMFEHRNVPPAPLDPRQNPFRGPGAVPLAATPLATDSDAGVKAIVAESVPGGPGPGASLALLQQGAATLKVSGIFEIGGRAHLVINARPYKEGDVVQTQVQGETVYLRVKEISRRSVTLSLNDAEMTLKY